ncbi:hypothetical protein ACFW08_05615 [Streptomyces sp. NPDC058960]|uniref:hypothetical protein n=1 Tax=Streptomyces sp. NPDC058960 TaxID=3346679 RepID=UPI003688EBD7
MQFEEHYLLTITAADGTITSTPYTDPADALDDYAFHSSNMVPGEKVQLVRHMAVTMASAVRAGRG